MISPSLLRGKPWRDHGGKSPAYTSYTYCASPCNRRMTERPYSYEGQFGVFSCDGAHRWKERPHGEWELLSKDEAEG